MEIINTYPTSAGFDLLLSGAFIFAIAMVISSLVAVVVISGEEEADPGIQIGLLVFWTILCIGIPIAYMRATADHYTQDEFYENMPTECAQAATGPNAQRRVECTITISKERDFVIIDGRFMPLEEAPDGDADQDVHEEQPRAQ